MAVIMLDRIRRSDGTGTFPLDTQIRVRFDMAVRAAIQSRGIPSPAPAALVDDTQSIL